MHNPVGRELAFNSGLRIDEGTFNQRTEWQKRLYHALNMN